MSVFNAVLARDLRVAFRRWSELAHPLIFFVIVVTLFPLALSPTASQLRDVGTSQPSCRRCSRWTVCFARTRTTAASSNCC
jgi:hypothetical protein